MSIMMNIAAALVAGSGLASTLPSIAPGETTKWRAILQPVGGGKVRGGAMAEAKGAESTRFTITIRDGTPNQVLPWHLHSGDCAAPGGVVGSGYPLLRVGPGGTAEAAITLAVPPPASGDYVIQVHAPSGTPISCGELKPIG